MPDVREVYEMVTKQKPPEPGALERQQRRQVRTARSKKIGALAVAAAISLAAVVLVLATRQGENVTTPATAPTVNPADTAAVTVVMGFLEAYGAFDAEGARTYLADNADISEMIPGGLNGLSLALSFSEAEGYRQTITSCEPSTLASDTTVVCEYDFHALGSDEIGRGPFSGSAFVFSVRDGRIVRASNNIDTAKFSPQMWEPFAEWVSTNYPKDAAVMYNDSLSDFRLTEESIRLWDQRIKDYVTMVQGSH